MLRLRSATMKSKVLERRKNSWGFVVFFLCNSFSYFHWSPYKGHIRRPDLGSNVAGFFHALQPVLWIQHSLHIQPLYFRQTSTFVFDIHSHWL